MASSIKCKMMGCDLDACGVCKRCGDESKADHDWREADRAHPCFRLRVCSRCEAENSQPDHDWDAVSRGGMTSLKCTRCDLRI